MTSSKEWLRDAKIRYELQCKNMELLAQAEHLDEENFQMLDSSVKKVTTFRNKLKNLSSPFISTPYLNDLQKLDVSRYLEEIASAIYEAKLKVSDIPSIVQFCVGVSSFYSSFPGVLLAKLKNHIPHKKGDAVENAKRLQFDLRLLAEFLLNGVFIGKEGTQFFGNAISFLTKTDRTEHANVTILLSFCRVLLFDIARIVPYSVRSLTIPEDYFEKSFLTNDQQTAISVLLNDYFVSLLEHTNSVRIQMNRIQKAIKRQERTRGDASTEDRQNFEQLKTQFDRLMSDAIGLGECLGCELPTMDEEPSDDEREGQAAKKLDADLAEGKTSIWADKDAQIFYEHLVDAKQFVSTAQQQQAVVDDKEEAGDVRVIESIEDVDLTELEKAETTGASDHDERNEDCDENNDDDEDTIDDKLSDAHSRSSSPTHLLAPLMRTTSLSQPISMHEFLVKLSHCINRELIDGAAVQFLIHLSDKKAHRKRLIQHFLDTPAERLDLLPFYARFLATIRPVFPELVTSVLHKLLAKFKSITEKVLEPPKRFGMTDEDTQKGMKINAKLHLAFYLSELAKFLILPKAEALSLLRTLLVNLRSFKVDMLCVMIESMGLFLYRSPQSHAKMVVILQVLKNKSAILRDCKQKILLENAYFSVIPSENEEIVEKLPPMQEYLLRLLSSSDLKAGTFRRIDWDDKEHADFMIRAFSTPSNVRFDTLPKLASLVRSLSDYHKWIGVNVLDEVLEFIRLALETNNPIFQQRLFSSVHYLGQLYNYNVCNTATVFHLLYQLISFDLPDLNNFPAEGLIVRSQRIRYVVELSSVIGEFFSVGQKKARMDNFFHFLVKLYFETFEKWPYFADVLGDFPDDIQYSLSELLQTLRKGDEFAKNLEEARQNVNKIEQQYKAKVLEITSKMRKALSNSEEQRRQLMCIAEDEEDEENKPGQDGEEDNDEDFDDEEEEEFYGRRIVPSSSREGVDESDNNDRAIDLEDDEDIVHMKHKPEKEPEDDEFVHEFERMMHETMQTAPVTLHGPVLDLEVPPVARQKFERKILFAPDVPSLPGTFGTSESLLPSSSLSHIEASSAQQRMALMTRTKGPKGPKIVLRAVELNQSSEIQDSWRREREEQEIERAKMKAKTLAIQERQIEQQQAEAITEANRRLNLGHSGIRRF